MVSDRDTLADKLSECTYEGMSPRETADALLAEGWRPPVRVIETDDELVAASHGIVVRAKDGTIAARFDQVHGVVFGDDRPFPWSVLRAPAVVLWEPEQEARR
ncbi:hypothetical protein [Nocardia cyriacigeorgica]|uniref:Uncharacterized protein n=1 Tax=Nocardia cyriacigeorgica TaxID=135487 RepID=A0A5R8NEH7_9NOCA|nr:hypothetical protein [Nocardia cyriacigeorgica]TLF74078.1 hypothetical protein FEK34_25500 [Nocardia cyriacigeorgica]